MTKRMTLTVGSESQKALVKLARKLSLETSTSWDAQEVLKRCVNIGLKHSMTAYFPKDKTPEIGS